MSTMVISYELNIAHYIMFHTLLNSFKKIDALIGKEKVVILWCDTIEKLFSTLKRREDHGLSIKGTFVFCDDFDGCNTGSNNCISVFTLICIISSGLLLERSEFWLVS